MISIDDEARLDSILNPVHTFSLDRMSTQEQNKLAIEIQSEGSSSTSGSSQTSHESLETRNSFDSTPVEVGDHPTSMPSDSLTSTRIPFASITLSSS